MVPVAVSCLAPSQTLDIRLGPGSRTADLGFVANTIRRMLALDLDLPGFYDRVKEDAELSTATSLLDGLRPTQTETIFEALVEAVIGQQISSNVANRIRDSLVERYGVIAEMDGVEFFAYPRPEVLLETPTEDLRNMSLSFRKVEYIKDIALRSINGQLDFRSMGYDAMIDEMTKVRGVGRWTAEWTALRSMGEADAFPAGDLALNRMVSELYFDQAPISEPELREFALKNWAPYRGLATTYLFARLRQKRSMDIK